MKYNLIYFKRTNIHPENLNKLKEKFNLIPINNFKSIAKISKNKIRLLMLYMQIKIIILIKIFFKN